MSSLTLCESLAHGPLKCYLLGSVIILNVKGVSYEGSLRAHVYL